jgi:hypothetical protein
MLHYKCKEEDIINIPYLVNEIENDEKDHIEKKIRK